MKKYFFGLLFFAGLLVPESFAQGTIRDHFIYFKDKAGGNPYSVSQPTAYLSPKALTRRANQNIPVKTRDLPVTPAYVAGLKNTGATVLYTSKWFNGALVKCDSVTLNVITNLSFVRRGETVNRSKPQDLQEEIAEPVINNLRVGANRSDYATSYKQAEMIGAIAMHDAGFRGENMTIAVFDAGFPGVNTTSPFAHLFQNNQIKGGFDFVDKDKTFYEKNSHGTNVLSTIGAFEPGKFIGTAYKANFYLFITEYAPTEHPREEYNWLFAAEYADSAGVDVINSSLGYTTFDYPSQSYSYNDDMDGNTAISTRAADLAAATGILVVNSAGNEGNETWRYIGAPADGDSVLTVGAVDSMGVKAGFSSFGPTFDGRVKPNLSALGYLAAVILSNGQVSRSNGTSFASPILCGMATAFWGANPGLTNMQVIQFLQQSASQSSSPNNNTGYGIPNFPAAQAAVQNALGVIKDGEIYPNPLISENEPIKIKMTKPYQGDFQVEVYDRTGRVLQKMNLSVIHSKEVSFRLNSNIGPGLYFMRLSWGNKLRVSRLVKL